MCDPPGLPYVSLADPARHCAVFEEFASFLGQGRTYQAQPQWWALAVDKTLVANAKELSLTLRRPASLQGERIVLGGSLTSAPPIVFDGPSLRHEATSIYRWEILGDGRLWEQQPLASLGTSSGIMRAGPGCEGDIAVNGLPAALPRWLEAGRARYNILLRIRYADGRETIL
jgi:hypothetical protein